MVFDSMNFNFDFLWDPKAKKLDTQFEEWLYGDWSEQKYKDYKFLNVIPGVHQYMDYLLDKRADTEYLNRYGMDFSDIHDPRKLSQSGSFQSLGSVGFNMISRNIAELYE